LLEFISKKLSILFSVLIAAGIIGVTGHISVLISAIHWSKWRSKRALDPASDNVGTLGSGGGSGVAKYLATSLAQSEYPARYLSVANNICNYLAIY